MADEVHSEAKLVVGVEGAQALASLTAQVQTLNRQVTALNTNLKPAAVTAAGAGAAAGVSAGVKAKGKAAEKEIEQQLTFGQRMLVRAVSTTIAAPVRAAVATFQFAGGALQSFAGAILPTLGRLSPMILATAGVGLAFTGLLVPLAKIIGGIKLMSVSFGWAQEQAQHALAVASETRRRYPGLVGEAFEAAAHEVEARMGTISGIVGKGAEGIAQSVEKRLMDFRLGRASRGDREMFERWGMNIQSRSAFERRTGKRADMLTYMELFVAKREELQKQLDKTPEGPQKQSLRNWLGRFADDTMGIFGKSVSDAMLTWQSTDVAKLKKQMAESSVLGLVPDADRKAIDFQISLQSLGGTFEAIKRGIGGDVQPNITKFMDTLRNRLLYVDANGRQLGKSLRDLGASMANTAWQTLDSLLRRIDVTKVNAWIAEINKINPDEAAESIINFADSVWSLIKVIGKGIQWFNDLSNNPIVKFFLEGSASAGGTMGGVVSPLLNPSGRGGGAQAAPSPATPQSAPAPGGNGPAVPAQPISFTSNTPMSDYERNALGLIRKYESGAMGNVMNYKARAMNLDPLTPKGVTAQGYYQILNTNWRFFAPKLGITAPNAMSASREDQERVALALFRHSGMGNWNAASQAAIRRGERAGDWASKSGADTLTPDKLNRSTSGVRGGAGADGASFGAAAGRSFLNEVRTVPLNIGVPETSSNVPPYAQPPPTGGDTPI